MSDQKLNALRREALIDILREMQASPARIEDWVHQIFMTATQPPPVVSQAAEILGQWNCYGNHPHGHQGNVRFVMQDAGDGYETIAEIVLTAAREFEEQTKEEITVVSQSLDHPPVTIPKMIPMLQAIQIYLSEIIGDSSATGYAKELKKIIDGLKIVTENFNLVLKTVTT